MPGRDPWPPPLPLTTGLPPAQLGDVPTWPPPRRGQEVSRLRVDLVVVEEHLLGGGPTFSEEETPSRHLPGVS